MRKLSQITESLWGSVRDRVNGDTERKEDEIINLMDKESFCEYLKDNYDCETDYTITSFDAVNKDELNVNVFRNQNQTLFFTLEVDDFNNNPYVAFRPLPGIIKPLQNKLEDKYDVWEDTDDDSGSPILVINPKDGSNYSNVFFIDVLDFILDNTPKQLVKELGKKTGISESLWGSIRDRVNGDTVRKEDEVNLMDGKQFYDYLQKHYNTLSKEQFHIDESFYQYTIGVPLLKKDKTPFYLFIDSYKDNDYCFLHMSSSFQKACHKLYYEKLKDNDIFDIDLVDSGSSTFGWFVEISTKDGNKPKNDFVIEVIDFILSQIENPFIKLIEKI